ncbi:hypothetical protein Clacol_005524 [Clathrus columnatus]|uniref:RBR-type E3 ubiquitin transferase n=1 Tax=Clathrus columnatus TaxID=1419009 RepID=A0AAV5ACH8_9AGAM|nr:hypothetical protein Clacol_005524 [Clathrus columnatus]
MYGSQCRDEHPGIVARPSSSPTGKQCIFWKSGICNKGDLCKFVHVDRTLNHPEQQLVILPSSSTKKTDNDDELTVDEASGSVEKKFPGHVRIIFGDGVVIRDFQTGLDSRTVIVANIPSQVETMELLAIAERSGNIKSLTFRQTVYPLDTRTAVAEYMDSCSAKKAAQKLDSLALHGLRLTARLDIQSAEIDAASLRSRTIRLTWYAPSMTAFVYYDSISTARQKAKDLNRSTFAGRKLLTTLQQPSFKQKQSFTVIVAGLPLKFSKTDFLVHCGSKSFKLGQSNYTLENGVESFQKLLETFGPLEDFDMLKSKWSDVKMKALVRFMKAEHAEALLKQLNNQHIPCLGKSKTYMTLLHSLKYNIPRSQYQVLQDELQNLNDPNDHVVTLQIYDKDKADQTLDPVCIRIYGEAPKNLATLKLRLERLLAGEQLSQDGVPLWDDFFTSELGKTYVTNLQSELQVFIRVDNRKDRISVCGSTAQIREALTQLSQKFNDLSKGRRYIDLKASQIPRLLRGELAELQRSLGTQITLDISTYRLCVQGDDDAVVLVKLALESGSQVSTLSNLDGSCPVCLCEIITPLQLKCRHKYCLECLRHHLSTAERFPLKCVGDEGSCGELIPLTVIHQILDPPGEAKLFQRAFTEYIRQNFKEVTYCPIPDCPFIYRSGGMGVTIRCFSCLTTICTHCRVENHEGMTCVDYSDHLTGGNEAFNRWKIDNDIKSCPNCTANIQKASGCNHMTCSQCQTHMCWICLKVFNKKAVDGPNGVYAHMRREHGGIGL